LPLHPVHGKYHLPATALDGQEQPVPVKLICFPEVAAQPSSQVTGLKRAVALARLMTDSVDNWDQAALANHVALLYQLSRQARSVALGLGRHDASQIPQLLERALLG
jgi:hypothetical protein